MTIKSCINAAFAAALVVGLSAASAAAKEPDRAKAAKVLEAGAGMGGSAATRAEQAGDKARYCFTAGIGANETKTTCRTRRQWSDKGITILTD